MKNIVVFTNYDFREGWRKDLEGFAEPLFTPGIDGTLTFLRETPEPFDLIIVDGRGNGVEASALVRRIRSDTLYDGPILAISNNASELARIMGAGCTHGAKRGHALDSVKEILKD